MLRSLDAVRRGGMRPEIFEMEEVARRVGKDFHLSKAKELDPAFKTPPLSMEIELSEGRYLLSGTFDGTVLIHDVRAMQGTPHTCKCIAEKGPRESVSVHCVSWYPIDTGMFYASSSDGMFRVWDTNRMNVVEHFRASNGAIYQHHSPTSSVSHDLVAIAGASPELKILDTRSGSICHELRRGHESGAHVYSCQWSPRGESILASGGSDGNITLWDVRSGKSRLGVLRSPDLSSGNSGASMRGSVNGLKFSSDGLFLVSFGFSDDRIRVWDALSFKQIAAVPREKRKSSKKSKKRCVNVALVPKCGSELLFYPDEKAINVADILAPARTRDNFQRVVNRLKLHYEDVTCFEFNPFENELYSAGWDNNVLVWSADKRGMQDPCARDEKPSQIRGEARVHRDTEEEEVPQVVPAPRGRSSMDEDAWSDDD